MENGKFLYGKYMEIFWYELSKMFFVYETNIICNNSIPSLFIICETTICIFLENIFYNYGKFFFGTFFLPYTR